MHPHHPGSAAHPMPPQYPEPPFEPGDPAAYPYRRELASFDVLILEEESFVPRPQATAIPVSALTALDRHAPPQPAPSAPGPRPTPQGRRCDGARHGGVRHGQSRLRRFAPVLWVAGLTALCSLAIGARVQVANALPATASLYAAIGIPANARGLDIRDVRSSLFDEQGQRYLLVEGKIANLRNAPAQLGALRLSLRDASGREIYTWSAPAPETRIGAAGSVPFKTRLASPPREAQDVLVRFGERG